MTADLLSPFSHADVEQDVWFLDVDERVLERPFTAEDMRPAWAAEDDDEYRDEAA